MPDSGKKKQSELAAFLEARPVIKTVDAIFADLSGVVRGKRHPVDQAEKLFTSGGTLPGSVFLLAASGDSLDPMGLGFTDGDPDEIAKAVPGTLKLVPWSDPPSARRRPAGRTGSCGGIPRCPTLRSQARRAGGAPWRMEQRPLALVRGECPDLREMATILRGWLDHEGVVSLPLDDLAASWRHHREHVEGAEGLFDVIENQAPRLEVEIGVLRSEHDRLDTLIPQVISGASDEARRPVVEQLVDEMDRHCARAVRVAYDAFDQEIGGGG